MSVDGTRTVTLPSLQLTVDVDGTPENVTVLPFWVGPKLLPVTVTAVLTGATVAETLVMFGNTVRVTLLLPAIPLTVTITGSVPAGVPTGTTAVMVVLVQLVILVAATPPKATVLCVEPKFVPLIVTLVPTTPEATDKLVTAGATVSTGAGDTICASVVPPPVAVPVIVKG